MRVVLVGLLGLMVATGGCQKKGGEVPADERDAAAVAPPSTPLRATAEERAARERTKDLKVETLVDGSGARAVGGKVVSMHYRGFLAANGAEFDSTYQGTPVSFVLGLGQVIEGWERGIVGMAVGGRRRLSVPPHLAYGDEEMPGIPAGSTLIFEVELVAVSEPTAEMIQEATRDGTAATAARRAKGAKVGVAGVRKGPPVRGGAPRPAKAPTPASP